MATNRDLLREAIADAKAVKETAIANAKAALTESFTPFLREKLSAKIQEMDERLIARINTTSRDFQTQINTVLQERVDEEGIAAKAFDKVQGFFGKDFKDKMTALD